jgi:hypothetical protein
MDDRDVVIAEKPNKFAFAELGRSHDVLFGGGVVLRMTHYTQPRMGKFPQNVGRPVIGSVVRDNDLE